MKKTTRLTVQSPPPPLGGDLVEETVVVGVYLRVSTDRQANEGDSLEEQENELRKYCDYRNFRIHKLYIERGKSGGNTNRPEYQALIKDIEARKINAVVVKKLDRLSRSLLDFEALMVTLQTHQVDFISLREQFDTTTAMGKAMLRVALVFAQLEREQNSERVSDVMTYRASLGLHNGGYPPFGYTCVNNEWAIFPKEKEIVELIFSRFRTARSTLDVAKHLNDTHVSARRGRLWDCRMILKILQNPSYLGHRKWKKQLFQNTQAPIISEKQFEETQSLLKRGSKPTNRNAPFQKLLTCGDCLSPLSPSFSLNHAKIRFEYYRCTQRGSHGVKPKTQCEIKQINFKAIHQRVLAAFDQLSTPTIFKLLETRITQHNNGLDAQQSLIQKQISLLNQKVTASKAQQDKYLDSLITGKFTAKERHRINEKLESLDLEEKQFNTQLNHHDFTIRQLDNQKLDPTQIKQAIATLQSLDLDDSPSFRDTLLALIKDITVHKANLTMTFHFLPWPTDISA